MNQEPEILGYQKPAIWNLSPISLRKRHWQRRRNPNKFPWSRPISAQVAMSTWQDPPNPKNITSPKLLVVGGDPSFIPDWIPRAGISFKHFNRSGRNFYDAVGNFEPNAILLFVKATTGHTKHQVLDYGKKHGVPVLIMSQGWGELIISAKSKGVNWLVEAYPHPIWVPKEYHERMARKRAKQEQKKTSPSHQQLAFAEKRRQIFMQQGITEDDAKFATTRYVEPGKTHCILCDKEITYKFAIEFALPGNPQIVQFYPVGSVCIREWINSLPASDRNRIKAQTEAELKKAQKQPPRRYHRPRQLELFEESD